jgi:hypothetical protein
MDGFTGDVAAGAKQVQDRFRQALEARADDHPNFARFEYVGIRLWLHSDETSLSPWRSRGRFYAKDKGFLLTARISFADWKNASWAGRVWAYAEAAILASNAISKTWIGPEERTALIALIAAVAEEVSTVVPFDLAPFEPHLFINHAG